MFRLLSACSLVRPSSFTSFRPSTFLRPQICMPPPRHIQCSPRVFYTGAAARRPASRLEATAENAIQQDGDEELRRSAGRGGRKPTQWDADSLRVLVVHPVVRVYNRNALGYTENTENYRLQEAVGLVEACRWTVAGSLLVPMHKLSSSTYLGTGKIEELRAEIAAKRANLVFMDTFLSPLQQRKLTAEWSRDGDVKVVDRFAVILEIFDLRAESKEAKLQVKLAHLKYKKTFLVGKHSSEFRGQQQRAGGQFMAGVGETQLELDRRLLDDEYVRTARQLEALQSSHAVQNKRRYGLDAAPLVAIVGYTNAGKSLLVNRLTGSDLGSENELFTSLSPYVRSRRLPSGVKALFLDTVGFVSNLPHALFSAFKATLQQVQAAHLIVHVCDVSNSETEFLKANVMKVLRDLEIDPKLVANVVEVWNKMDLLPPDRQRELLDAAKRAPPSHPVFPLSALLGFGMPELIAFLDKKAQEISGRRCFELVLYAGDGEQLSYLYGNAQVVDFKGDADGNTRVVVIFEGPKYEIYLSKYQPLMVTPMPLPQSASVAVPKPPPVSRGSRKARKTAALDEPSTLAPDPASATAPSSVPTEDVPLPDAASTVSETGRKVRKALRAGVLQRR